MNHYHNEEDWNHENSPVINHSVLNKVLEFMSMGTNRYKKSMGAKRVQKEYNCLVLNSYWHKNQLLVCLFVQLIIEKKS